MASYNLLTNDGDQDRFFEVGYSLGRNLGRQCLADGVPVPTLAVLHFDQIVDLFWRAQPMTGLDGVTPWVDDRDAGREAFDLAFSVGYEDGWREVLCWNCEAPLPERGRWYCDLVCEAEWVIEYAPKPRKEPSA